MVILYSGITAAYPHHPTSPAQIGVPDLHETLDTEQGACARFTRSVSAAISTLGYPASH